MTIIVKRIEIFLILFLYIFYILKVTYVLFKLIWSFQLQLNITIVSYLFWSKVHISGFLLQFVIGNSVLLHSVSLSLSMMSPIVIRCNDTFLQPLCSVHISNYLHIYLFTVMRLILAPQFTYWNEIT